MTYQHKRIIQFNPVRIIGNTLIVISLLGFAYIFYPLIWAYIPQTIPENFDKTSAIYIPKIHAYSPVIKNVDPFDEAEYDQALRHGVAMAKGSVAPGDRGLTYLFAHSSADPWELTRFNTIFLRLGELSESDEILVYENGNEVKYKVVDKKEVDPSEVSYLIQNEFDGLILQTCSPIGTDFRRLLIFAKKIS